VFGINVFLRVGDQIYRSYFTTARAAEKLSSVWAGAGRADIGGRGT
jgi:Bacterial protein of unknown function (DUF899)